MPLLQRAEYSILEVCLPAQRPTPFGVVLLDPQSDRVYQRFRDDISSDAEDAEILALLPDDIESKACSMGGERLLAHFEDTLSSTLRMTDRRAVAVHDFEAAVERLYQEHIAGVRRERAKVIQFVTHVPLYSLRAAAGLFGEDMEAEPEDWVQAPAGVQAARDLYAVHVAGHSMEPEIPDGSVAVFRFSPAGSRQGKRVLVWRRGASDAGGEFTVKVYESRKRMTSDGWEHNRIRLKPLNPDYPVLELDGESEYRVLGELVRVLGIDEL
jgi:phage repressor protein C with HTH and peptisase S24 domain